MTQLEFTRLLERFGQGLCSPDEQQQLERWLDSMPTGGAPFRSGVEKEQVRLALLEAVHRKMLAKPEPDGPVIRPLPVTRPKTTRWFPNPWVSRFAVAASVVLLLWGGLYFYLNNRQPAAPTQAQKAVEILPGSDKATLTLADGSTIRLTDALNGTLAQQGNTVVRKTRTGEIVYEADRPGRENALGSVVYNTISIPRGGQYRLVLSDGTNVWLNAASSLRYPAVFAGDERTVTLTGEGYFEVAPNREKPFHVKTATQEITVLGTHFNVNAYDNEPTVKTTLLEGAVSVAQLGASQRLVPGQQAITTAVGQPIRVQSVDTEDAVAWKNGLFRFNKTDLKTVMRQLERWYDVEVTYEGNVPNRTFTGEIYRNVSAAQLLDILSYSTIHFRIETKPGNVQRKLIITP